MGRRSCIWVTSLSILVPCARGLREPAEILEPLEKHDLEEVVRLIEKRWNFSKGLREALQEARTSVGGACLKEGEWAYMGCAPVRWPELRCGCGAWLGLPQTCIGSAQSIGELEDNMDVETTRRLYAGECQGEHNFHRRALELVVAVVGIMAIWCVASGRAAREMEEEQVTEGQQLGSEESKHREEDERHREALFGELVRDSKWLHSLAVKVSALPPPPDSEAIPPVKSNIYRYWAFGGRRSSWLHYLGLRFVLLIQLVAPAAMLRQGYYHYNWRGSRIRFVNYSYGSAEFGASHVLGRLLQLCFTYCVGLHGLSTLKRAAAENAMLSCLFAELKRLKDDSKSYMNRGGEAWLLLDCVMTCYVILLGLVDLVLVFTESTSPKDVCFDALGLLFIFHLHEADGGLSFVSVKDLNEDRIGELCHRMARDVTEKPETPMEQLRASRLERYRQRRSTLFLLTEVGIYIILLFFPVFQLFIQDGLVSREGGVNMGVLAAHVLQGQATRGGAQTSSG